MNDSELMKSLARHFLKAMTSGDIDQVTDLVSEDFVYWVAGSLPHSGSFDKAGFIAILKGVSSVFEGPFSISPTGFIVDGRRIAVEAQSDGRTVNGKEFRNQYHFLMEFRDGKAVLLKEYMDTALSAEVFGS